MFSSKLVLGFICLYEVILIRPSNKSLNSFSNSRGYLAVCTPGVVAEAFNVLEGREIIISVHAIYTISGFIQAYKILSMK